MALSAQLANQLTNDSAQRNLDRDVRDEITLAESQIRQRAGLGLFTLSFNARIIGNPIGNPQNDDALTERQIDFREHFIDLGYLVSIDPQNGNWFLNWEDVGAESKVSVYSIRTTVTPGAISQQTIDVIDNFFDGLTPSATSKTEFTGDLDETLFGATTSNFYEYTSVVEQQDDTDHSSGVLDALRASGLGYIEDTRITGVGGATNTTTPTNTLDISDGSTTVTITVGGTGSATDFVSAVNNNTTLQAINIRADISGPDLLLINDLAGILIATNNVGDVLGDLFGLASPQTGVVTDNTEVFKII